MLLRSITVENWRCFAGRHNVGPLDDRLNVIHGPNGAGKSSLLLALARGMFDRHDTQDRHRDDLVPWGRDLAPTVVLEFENNGELYRLTKRFVRDTICLLERREGAGRFVPLCDGRPAADQARQFLSAGVQGRGLSQAADWGLAQVLWTPQHGMALEKLNSSLAQAVQQSLGSAALDSAGEAMATRIEKVYLEHFTPTGKPRGGAGSPQAAREAELSSLRNQQAALARKLLDFDDASRRIGQAEADSDRLRSDIAAKEAELEQARLRARDYERLAGDVKQRRAALDASRANYQRLQHRDDAIRQAEQTRRELSDRLQLLQEQLPKCRHEAEQARSESDEVERRRAAIDLRRQEVAIAEMAATQAAEYMGQLAARDAIREQLDLLDKLTASRDAQRDELTRLAAPDPRAIDRLEKALARRAELRWRRESVLLHVEIRPETRLHVEIETAESAHVGEALQDDLPATPAPGSQPPAELESEQPIHLRGPSLVAFRIPGVGTVRASAPVGSLEDLDRQLAESEQQVRAASEALGSDDLTDLKTRRARADVIEREHDTTQARIEGLLQGRSIEMLRDRKASVEREIARLESQYGAWRDTPPDVASLTASGAELRAAFERDERELSAQLEASRNRLNKAQLAESTTLTRLEETRKQIDAADQQLIQQTADGKTPREREDELNHLAMEARAEEQLLAAAEQTLRGWEGDPTAEVERLQRLVRDLRLREADAAKTTHQLQGRLEQLIAEAPHTRLAEVDERIARLTAEQERNALRQQAAALLWRTIEACRKEMVDSILAPVEHRTEQILQRIGDTRLGAVALAGSFLPEGVAPPAAAQRVTIDRISGGEQEQVHFAARLALAELICADRTLLVFDDAFVASDAARLAKIQELLIEATDRFQILLFTCHPERYTAADARHFDLQSYGAEAAG